MKKYVKWISCIVALLLVSGTFASCDKAGTELADLMIIQGIGIDSSLQGYRVTVEILNNEQSGSPGGEGSGDNKTKIYTAEGESVAQALRTLITKSGNEPLFAHNRVIIVGDTVKSRISDVLDFFIRNYDSRASQLLCVAKESSAESIVRAKLLKDTVKSEILENMLEESNRQSLVPLVRVIDAVNCIKSDTSVLCIPAVTVQKNGENEDYKLDGCALFDRNEMMTKYLSAEESAGLCFLNDDIRKGYFTAVLPDGVEAAFVINKGSTDYSVTRKDGKLIFNASIKLSCDIDEVGGEEYSNNDRDFFRQMKDSIAVAIADKCKRTLYALKEESGGDALRYGRRLELYDNNAYNLYIGDWQKHFKNAETVISVDITIRRIGEETFHSNKTE